MGSKPCDGCGKMITFAKDGTTGRWMPINDESSPDGNIRFNDDGTASVLGGDVLKQARELGEHLHLSHFVDCPKSKSFRR